MDRARRPHDRRPDAVLLAALRRRTPLARPRSLRSRTPHGLPLADQRSARGRRLGRRRVDIQLDLVAVGVADGETSRVLAEGDEPVRLDVPPRDREVVSGGADAESDVVEAGDAFRLRARPGRAGQLAGDIVMVDAGREEHDAAVLARAGLGETEHIAIEMPRGVEVA